MKIEGKEYPDEHVMLSPSLRFNVEKGGYEILSGNTWCGVPSMYRSSIFAMLEDMEGHPERRNPFDKDDTMFVICTAVAGASAR